MVFLSRTVCRFWRSAMSSATSIEKVTSFRHWISNGPDAEFPAEAGRYHLYYSLACPFASRANFVLHYKGLQNVISSNVLHYLKGDGGWEFVAGPHRTDADTVNGKKYLREVYLSACPEYGGRFSVPVLFDKQTKRIVSNESGDIIRMFNSEFNAFCASDRQREIDLCPAGLVSSIDEWNALIGDAINSGVYRCGFATSQEAYDGHAKKLFDVLDQLEDHLSKNRYLCGNVFTEADIRLFMSLVRFDPVYVGAFKCNKRRIMDYPNLWPYTREIYQLPNVEPTIDRHHIEHHYQASYKEINPYGIVAVGPVLDFKAAHGRDAQFSQ